jgi:hypothetical protein
VFFLFLVDHCILCRLGANLRLYGIQFLYLPKFGTSVLMCFHYECFFYLALFMVILDHHAWCLGFSVMIQDLLESGCFSHWECFDLVIPWRKSNKLFLLH